MSKSPLDTYLDRVSLENAQPLLGWLRSYPPSADEAEACWYAHLARRGQRPNLYGRVVPGPAGTSSFESVPRKPEPLPRAGDLVELPRADALWLWARFCRVLSVDSQTGTARLRPDGWQAGVLERKVECLRVLPAYGYAGMRGEGAA